jgi:hypothetical protein
VDERTRDQLLPLAWFAVTGGLLGLVLQVAGTYSNPGRAVADGISLRELARIDVLVALQFGVYGAVAAAVVGALLWRVVVERPDWSSRGRRAALAGALTAYLAPVAWHLAVGVWRFLAVEPWVGDFWTPVLTQLALGAILTGPLLAPLTVPTLAIAGYLLASRTRADGTPSG